MSKNAVRCRSLSLSYGETVALADLDLEVQAGEILAVIGPSGCGKTSLLRLIAGFERPTAGMISLDDKIVAGPGVFDPPEIRGVGMVFQDYALFPHLNVLDNVAFGLNPAPDRQTNARSLLTLVGLEAHASRFPHELSGGERQRVALARALAPRPILILLDEPFSNLDSDRRLQMREEVRAILKTMTATAIFVTHDQEEALFMGDQLAVMRQGRLEQFGQPEEIFHRPASRFVAEFMGQTDFLPGTITAEGIQTEVGLLLQPSNFRPGQQVDVAFRADDVTFEHHPDGNALVLARNFKGSHNLYRLRLPSGRLLHVAQPHALIFKPGTRVRVEANPGHPLACFPNGTAEDP